MKKEYTNEYPELRKPWRNKLIDLLEEFTKREEKIMLLTPEPGEYVSVRSMASSLGQAIKSGGYPMQVHIRKGKVYVTKLI